MLRCLLLLAAFPTLLLAQAPADTLTLGDGTRYVGEVRDGVPHGRGTLAHADGWSWRGTWREGAATGTGTYALANGRSVDAPLPTGAASFRPASAETPATAPDPRDAATAGAALPDDDLLARLGASDSVRPAVDFAGVCVDGDCADGEGTLERLDGVRYQGSFREGVPHGTGLVSHPSGWMWRGTWANGVPARRGRLTHPPHPPLHSALPTLDEAPDLESDALPAHARPHLPSAETRTDAQRRALEEARDLLDRSRDRTRVDP